MKYIKILSKQKLIGNNFIHFIDLTLKNEVEKQQIPEKYLKESKNNDSDEIIQFINAIFILISFFDYFVFII